jgi:DNA integrity scanning protein DisA with diadenylate cyclase activity
VAAKAVVLYADAFEGHGVLHQLLRTVAFPTILVTRSQPTERSGSEAEGCTWVSVPDVPMTRVGQVKLALLVCLARQVLQRGDRVVCLTGVDGSAVLDTLMVLNLDTEPELFATLGTVPRGSDVRPEVFERTLGLAVQLATEGREGRPVGTIFVLGDEAQVLLQSRNLILNPFRGYAEAERNLLDPALEETLKEFAALDGAFLVRGDGVVLAAGTQLLPHAAPGELTAGLGTRHGAAAAITASTGAVAVTISQSTGTVSIFKSGRMITSIHPPVSGSRVAGRQAGLQGGSPSAAGRNTWEFPHPEASCEIEHGAPSVA